MKKIYIDEAGRGPLAGPLYVGAILPLKTNSDLMSLGFKDSKKCSESQRNKLFSKIFELQDQNKILLGIGSVSSIEIDKYGITRSINLAIRRAIADMIVLSPKYKLYIDGNTDFGLRDELGIDIETIIKGDQKITEISMASILAKVSRDNEMIALNNKFPQYNFIRHKGYGTLEHRNLIAKHGPSKIHRKLFLKEYFPNHVFKIHKPSKNKATKKRSG